MSINLIIGASGLVGGHLKKSLISLGETVVGTSFDDVKGNDQWLDIRLASTVDQLMQRLKPAVVYLPAALTNVDYCELHPNDSFAVNVLGIGNVLRAAKLVQATIVFFSSDYIFDGTNGPYSESDVPNPLSVYGQHKVIGELLVSQEAKRWLIIRTTVVYGTERQGKNFIYRLQRVLSDQQLLNVPVDQVGSPTYAPNMADIVVELVSQGATGVFNVVGPSLVNRYAFAQEAATVLGLDPALIKPVSTTALSQPAKRPLHAGLRTAKIMSTVTIPLVDYHQGLPALAKELALCPTPT